MDYALLVFFVIAVGFLIALTVGILRAILAIPERIQLQREILAELQKLNDRQSSNNPN